MGQKLGNNLSQREASGVVLDPNDGQFPSRDPSGAWAGCAIRRFSFHHRWGWRVTRYAYCTSDYRPMSLLPRFSSLQILVVTTTLTKDLVAVESSYYFCDICVPKISRYVFRTTLFFQTWIGHKIYMGVFKAPFYLIETNSKTCMLLEPHHQIHW